MIRSAMALVAALALAACGTQDTNGGDAAATAGAADSCPEAWAAVAEADLAEMQTLDEASAALDDTIQQCPSAQEWVAQAILHIEGIDDDQALLFLEGRCRQNPELADINACAEQ